MGLVGFLHAEGPAVLPSCFFALEGVMHSRIGIAAARFISSQLMKQEVENRSIRAARKTKLGQRALEEEPCRN